MLVSSGQNRSSALANFVQLPSASFLARLSRIEWETEYQRIFRREI